MMRIGFWALATFGLLAGNAWASSAPVPMVLVTTPKYTDEMRVVDGNIAANRPGHHAELMVEAGKQCGAAVEFRFVPWQRALLQVKNGDADGAFSSSYDDERATYGAYPMINGNPDSTRALKGYSYSLYVPRHPAQAWDGRVAAERGSSIIPRLIEQGFSHVEINDTATMLRMVAGGRVSAAAIITSVADSTLAAAPDLAAAVTRREPPLEDKFGYVMLSKPFYTRHQGVAECFWNAIRAIKATPQHAERVQSYQAEK